jgi:enamine deaminase RidA (YjgF/YER057c/UK114 family)
MREPTGSAGLPRGGANEEIRRRLEARGLALPAPWRLPPDARIPAALVRVTGTRVWVSGHVPLDADGTIARPLGRVDAEVDLAAAQSAGVGVLLAILASLEQALGDLGRVRAWCRLFCMVNASPGFDAFPAVFNPASQVLLDLFGEEVGQHSRVAIGVAGLPWNVPVEIQADLELEP